MYIFKIGSSVFRGAELQVMSVSDTKERNTGNAKYSVNLN